MIQGKKLIMLLTLGAAGVAGWAGSQYWIRLRMAAQSRAAIVTGKPFVIRTKETITTPDGRHLAPSIYTEARSSDGTRYSYHVTTSTGLSDWNVVFPDGVAIRAAPSLTLKTTTRMTWEEFGAWRADRQDPARRCAVTYGGQVLPGTLAGVDRVAGHEAVKMVEGDRMVTWQSTEFACVELMRHAEYRGAQGQHSETNRELVSLQTVEPDESLTGVCGACVEVGPLERMKRVAEFAGSPMPERVVQVYTERDADYRRRAAH